MSKEQYKATIEELAKQTALYPKEAPMKVGSSQKRLLIGIPVEKELQEKRLCLTPESVGLLVNNGHEVIIETGAGDASHYPDHLYSDKGAQISYSCKEVFQSDIVLKVEPPSKEEIDYMNKGATLVSALQVANLTPDYLVEINKKKITGVAFEFIEDKGGLKPVVRSMSEIAANCVVNIAGEYLSNNKRGMGVIFGGVTGVPPIKLIILGAGTVGEHVARVAKSLGIQVQVYDNQHYKLRRMKKDLGEELYTSIIDNHTLSKEIQDADVVVGALRSDEAFSQCVVTEEMVQSMKPGALMIDVSISQGGCFETSRITSHDNPVYKVHDVFHYCVPNIPSRVSRTATRALSYIFSPILLQVGRVGGIEDMMAQKKWFRKGVYSYKGCIVNENIARKFGVQCKDLELMLAARY